MLAIIEVLVLVALVATFKYATQRCSKKREYESIPDPAMN
jgi:hypothetical protein